MKNVEKITKDSRENDKENNKTSQNKKPYINIVEKFIETSCNLGEYQDFDIDTIMYFARNRNPDIKSYVSKILNTDETWHDNEEKMKKLCKKYKIPFNKNTKEGLTCLMIGSKLYTEFMDYLDNVICSDGVIGKYEKQLSNLMIELHAERL